MKKLFLLFSYLIISSFSIAEIVLRYEFEELAGTPSNQAVNDGSGLNTNELASSLGTINGSGQLVISANSGRVNTSMGSDYVDSSNIYYRIDFNSWDTGLSNTHTKFGVRLRSANLGDPGARTNEPICVRLSSGTGSAANLNILSTEGTGEYVFIQGGIGNPNYDGLSVIIGLDLDEDTFTIFTDNGYTGNFSASPGALNLALNIDGKTDFSEVNAIILDPGGGVVNIDRIALGTDYEEIANLPLPDLNSGDNGTGSGGTGDGSDDGDDIDNGGGSLGSGFTGELSSDLNVLFIVCDDLNDFEGVFGGHPQAQTPQIDALAAQSIRFVNAHTNAPICGPSRSSFMTGIYPHNSKIFGFENWYNPGRTGFTVNSILQNSKTLQHYMRDNGYDSYGSGKLMHYDLRDNYVYPAGHPEAGNLQEFWDEYGDPAWAGPFVYNQNTASVVNHPKIPDSFYQGAGSYNSLFGSLADLPRGNNSSRWWNATWQSSGSYRYVNDNDRDDLQDERVRKWATEKIDELSAQDPNGENNRFIMSIGFHNPHTPFIAPKAYFDLYPVETLQLPPRIEGDVDDTFFDKNVKLNQSTLHVYQSMVDSVGEASADGTVYNNIEDFIKAYLQAYLACISFVDTQIGLLIEALDASPYADNTVVILTSDHGYEWGEKEALSKNTLWENSTRVPLLIRVPGLESNSGKQVDSPVSLVDLYPTIRDLCDLHTDTKKTPLGRDLDGHSLIPLLRDPDNGSWSGPPVALSMVSGRNGSVAGNKNFAVRSRDWRYIRYENGMEELYDHSNDPYEFTNLIGSADPLVQQNYEQLVVELFSLVPELATDPKNHLVDSSFEWLPDVSSPNPGEEMWFTTESPANGWQIKRNRFYAYNYGNYSLTFDQRWTSAAAVQTIVEPLNSNMHYALSFWMQTNTTDMLTGSNDVAVSVELWTSPNAGGTYLYRDDWVTNVENSTGGQWEQFSGIIDASLLSQYHGHSMQLRIQRNDNVKQIIYLDELILDAYQPNSYGQWAREQGMNAVGKLYDIDSDGLSALEEYAYGGDPQDSASTGFRPELSLGNNNVSFYFPHRKNTTLQYQVEYTTNISNNSWLTAEFVLPSTMDEYDEDYWKAISTFENTSDACFFRTKIIP